MSVKAFYTTQGIVLGDATEQTDGSWKVENPAMMIPQREQMAFVPFLALMEEKSINIKASDILYGQAFTPAIDVRNHYNKLFGSGIVEAGPADVLQL